jgi:ABC-type transport system involved in multi-copper enzyme maturation permease subunit
MMALDSFGREISAGTLPLLLSQPTPRARIWWMKAALLAVALAAVLLVWSISFALHFREMLSRPGNNEWKDTMLLTPALFTLVMFSGGLWTVLFFRQVAAAFWFTLIAPGAILITIVNVVGPYPAFFRSVLSGALILYSVAGFVWARRLFLSAQDVVRTGREITLPDWRRATAWLRTRQPRTWRSRSALWKKEFMLHQSQYVLAGALALLHLGLIITRKLGDFHESLLLQFTLEYFWVVWMAMPLLVGCTAVAEERRLGTLESQLCLPVQRRRQFFTKLLSAVFLSWLLGLGMPLLLEGLKILPDIRPKLPIFGAVAPDGNLTALGDWLDNNWHLCSVLLCSGLVIFIAVISFYASTMARNTLQALAPGVLGILLTWIGLALRLMLRRGPGGGLSSTASVSRSWQSPCPR